MSDSNPLRKEKPQDATSEETRPLRASVDIPEKGENFGSSPLDGFFKKLELIQDDFQTYISLTKVLKDKRKTEAEENFSTYDSEKISKDARNMLQTIKYKIQELIKYCNDTPVEISDSQIRISQVKALKKKLLKAIEDSQKAETEFRTQLKNKSIRQFKIAYPDATEEDIGIALDSGSTGHFSQSLIDSTRSEEAANTLDLVQDRHQDIKRIENSVIELQSLYSQLQNLTELQEPLLEKIDEDLTKTNQNLEEASSELDFATKYSKAAKRKRLYMCIFISIFASLLLAAIILYCVLNRKL